jgi:hypothetical protein
VALRAGVSLICFEHQRRLPPTNAVECMHVGKTLSARHRNISACSSGCLLLPSLCESSMGHWYWSFEPHISWFAPSLAAFARSLHRAEDPSTTSSMGFKSTTHLRAFLIGPFSIRSNTASRKRPPGDIVDTICADGNKSSDDSRGQTGCL